ncbi:hypothetical protein QO003_002888 [Arthrobacter silviterrae]|uniref:Uncharacterized protein n=1 Tax=Arthrobacter silviterrae TaxID=2026658 RepID=A0ABX0D5J3_9MICC|nr:hypothetical protein [Arthrobacter silviterrae]MDQ0278585.1 hypothetical protein [Arthrobacter silviterrae]NGN82159.1 hypothetical protein [Arthrobacter silviterrae]
MKPTRPIEAPGADGGRLIFSSYGHMLGLADGVLFGGRRPPCKRGPAAAQGKVPAADSGRSPVQCPDGPVPGR